MNKSTYTCEWVMGPASITSSPSPEEWVIAHSWISHGKHMKKSRHTYEWVMAHEWMSHGTPMNESWLGRRHDTQNECALPPPPMPNKSWRRYEWVMAHTRMSHGVKEVMAPRMNVIHRLLLWRMSHNTYEGFMAHTYEGFMALWWIMKQPKLHPCHESWQSSGSMCDMTYSWLTTMMNETAYTCSVAQIVTKFRVYVW